MKKLTKYLFLLISITVGANADIPTKDIEIEQLSPMQGNFKCYHTYTILKSSGIDRKYMEKRDPAELKKIEREIDTVISGEMRSRGKREVEKDPQFYIAYSAGIDKSSLSEKLDDAGKESLQSLPQAAIVIMLADAGTGKLLWMSTAQGNSTRLPESEKEKRIAYAIKKMLGTLRESGGDCRDTSLDGTARQVQK